MMKRQLDKVMGVILAGGNSSRMGRNKALLPWKGKRLVDHICCLLKESGAEEVVVSGSVPGYHCILDKRMGFGPIGGLSSVLDTQSGRTAKFLLVCPVDMPLLRPMTLRRLLLFAQNERTADIVHFTGYVLPAVFRSSNFLKKTVSQIAKGEREKRSIYSLISRLNGRALKSSHGEEEGFINVNTAEEWEQLQKEGCQ